jgi:hypothetical protein
MFGGPEREVPLGGVAALSRHESVDPTTLVGFTRSGFTRVSPVIPNARRLMYCPVMIGQVSRGSPSAE